jgi:hypothetical protein
VKDSFVPDPSLVKVVKDSTLTILLSFRSDSVAFVKQGHIWGFSAEWGALSMRKKGGRFGQDLGDLEGYFTSEVLAIPGHLFSSFCGGFSCHIHLFSQLCKFPEGGHIGSWRY